MNWWKLTAYLCFAMAALAIVLGAVLTAGLIKEYGSNVHPVQLAGQASVLWLPPTVILMGIGAWCSKRALADRS